MKLKNIFRREKPIEEMGTISLTFKMPLISFLQHFKRSMGWEVNFSENELNKIEKAVKKAREGKSQDLVFEDELAEYLQNLEHFKDEYLKKMRGGEK